MAESVTPETARQAVQAWKDIWLDPTEWGLDKAGNAGDALAVLVPELVEHARQADEEAALRTHEVATLLDRVAQADAANAEAQKTLTMVRQQRDDARAAWRAADADRGDSKADLRAVHDRLHKGVRGGETFESCVWCASFETNLRAALGDAKETDETD